MSEFYGMNTTDVRTYEMDYRRQQLTAAFARRTVRDTEPRSSIWRRRTVRGN